MGNFFTSTQIYNESIVQSKKFIDMFCKAMKKEGYVTCEGDESEKSYILRFADNCRWVTIVSEDYDEGNAAADAGKIAKMLGTTCVNTNVIDSDCAIMEMYGSNGKKADTIIMGRSDDYFGKNIPLPAENAWKSFLTEGSSWEKLCEIVNDSENYIFVEEGLSELATLIGMDERNISFSADEATEDEYTVFLDFKKAAAKKEKKLTLNAAFKQVYGEMLEPLGFKLVNSRYPYYVRIINNEILHVITFVEEHSIYKKFKSFRVFGGIATIYRPEIDFSISPKMNYNWLNDVHFVYWRLVSTDDRFTYRTNDDLMCFNCSIEPEQMLIDMRNTFSAVKNIIIYAMDKYIDIDSCMNNREIFSMAWGIYDDDDFGKNYSAYNENEGLLFIKRRNRKALEANFDKFVFDTKKNYEEDSSSFAVSFEEYINMHKKSFDIELQKYDKICNSDKLYSKAIEELEIRAYNNRIKLKKYGIM